MDPKNSLFDQAAEKLREAMGRSASGYDRMRLTQEALALYHLHCGGEDDPIMSAAGGECVEDRPSA